MQQGFTHTIDGKAEAGATAFEVINPASGEAFALCPDATREQLDRAVAAARRAFPEWRRTPQDRRREALRAFGDAVKARTEEIATLLTREQGKPLQRAREEIQRALVNLDGILATKLETELLRDDARGRVELQHHPLGVIGAITPWNVPVLLAMPKIAQALYTGNTIVLKPSPYTPLTTLLLGEIARAHFPPGVVNIVAGGNALGAWMTEHPGIDKISFTGSVATGKRVMASAANTLKRVTLELGGNDAAIVLDDVDVKAVAPKLFWASFGNSGQICQAIKRLYVHDSIYEELCAALVAVANTVKVGEGFEEGVLVGPVQNKMQYERVLELLADTKKQNGVRILCGGDALPRPGYFIAPTIVADIAEGTRLVDEEPFGPVLPVIRFSHVDDAIRRANDSRFGLAGSVWSADPARAKAAAEQLEVGTAWINHHLGVEPDVPFGGFKESGIGREYGVDGLRHYTEIRAVSKPNIPPRPAAAPGAKP
ncbi:MAG: aldehyde dehydrogenase family protein [Rudaea sp.]|uniref:aldehyde dehydrogenase family protein n=1 Tax=unclassified Rudaea TaxID=2627037 RepID=UPI0010F5FD20|nr:MULTISPECIES: aldehyde dehydrogenase family protein [unclassified Rudaea]MBN8885687.1 aldehyde dehydrogenase family protein [Rudaea sp.]